MYLIGDIGNTEIKVCLVNLNNKIIKKSNFLNEDLSYSKIQRNFRVYNNYYPKIKKILFCSVVPNSFNLIKKFLKKKTKINCLEIKQLNLKSMIQVKVNYNQVGSDRLTNAISLANEKKNFIIIDFGTATTFDVLIRNKYIGGIIAPGIRISLNTLSDKASLIPKIDLKNIKKVIGKDTVSAVRSGFFWGYTGLIDNIVKLIKKETRKSFDVVITGGFSKLLENSIKTKVVINKDITLKGLIKILGLIKR